MAEIKTFRVTIERTQTTTVDWDVDMAEFSEWSSSPSIDIEDVESVRSFIESDRYYADALADKVTDATDWRDAYSDADAKITKVAFPTR